MNQLLLNYVQNFLVNYATNLTNNLIEKMDINSFCAKGICYYSRCQNLKCDIQFCKYHLITGHIKCTDSITSDVLKKEHDFMLEKLHHPHNNENTSHDFRENEVKMI